MLEISHSTGIGKTFKTLHCVGKYYDYTMWVHLSLVSCLSRFIFMSFVLDGC